MVVKKTLFRLALLVAATTPLMASVAPLADGERRPNVLFVIFDDLTDWIKPFDSSSPIVMPNLDRLAQRGVMFRRAYCAAPQCNPSRTALLSGFQPTTTGVYENASDWKQAIPRAVMLPRYFREHGYLSVGAGKIYHHVDRHFHDEASFDRYLPFVTDRLPSQKLNALTRARTPAGDWEALAPTFDWGPSPTPESDMLDTRSATFAVDLLRQSHAKPFFLAVGFFRPHLPYFSPQRFLDRYPAMTMPLPPVKADDLDDVPDAARAMLRPWARMFRGIQQASEPEAKWREAIAAYAAGATYADAQLGRVLDALDASPDRDNTVIVAWSDNGYHLGEKDHWTKFVLWEKSTHVPMVIVAPGLAKAGGICDRPVSLVDVYPSLLELCGLPARPELDGLSLVPLLRDPAAPRSRPAITTQGPGNDAIRTDRWRYIHYADDTAELYDEDHDPHEWSNLAGDPRHTATIAELKKWLPKKSAAPAPDFVPPAAVSATFR